MVRKTEFGEGSDTAYCAVGAIDAVADTLSERLAVESALAPYVAKAGFKNIPNWNDDTNRTLDEVREMLLTAAKDIRNGE